MSAAKGSTDSLPHAARCLCRPLLEENYEPHRPSTSASPCPSSPPSTQTQQLIGLLCFLFLPSARGRTNLELREKFILPEGASQGLAAFRSRGRRSKPGSRNASPTRSSSSASHSGASLPSAPSAPATPTASASSRSSHTHSRDYAKPWLAHSKTPTPTKCHCCPDLGHSHSTPGHEVTHSTHPPTTTQTTHPPTHLTTSPPPLNALMH
ncbi:hypothetical protein INR49_008113 [Caranx melampygus]|nr:hypothetical protein INR49_008113 [Caranx melampygus]